MRIENNEILKTLYSSAESVKTVDNNIQIFETKDQNQSVLFKSAQGISADVELSSVEKSAIPAFNKQRLQIKTTQGQVFNINVFIQSSADIEKVDKLSKTLTKTLSNLPLNILEDMQKECKHIFILKNIPHNIEAKALAIGPLNQIFLSSDKVVDLSEEELSDTLTHETGHLIDQTNCHFTGKASNMNKRSFATLKELLTPDLGFDQKSHSLANVSEFFADYYLKKSGFPSKNHRCISLFNKLDEYKNDFKLLDEEALNSKYGKHSEKIRLIAKKWAKLENDFIYFLTNINSGEVERMDENAKPMSLEQIDERNQRIKKKAKP